MGNQIHPTAIVHPKAVLGKNNYVGPYCLIDECAHIGDNNRFEAFVSVGTPPEYKAKQLDENNEGVIIGDENVFKEFVTINRGTATPTWIGNRTWMLTKSHLGHDALLEDDVTISCAVFIGGHSVVMEGANLGLGTVVHQQRVVGPYCMVGMNSTVTKNAFPFLKLFGSPAKIKGINEIGLIRSGVDPKDLVKFHNYAIEVNCGELDLISIDHPYRLILERFGTHCMAVNNG